MKEESKNKDNEPIRGYHRNWERDYNILYNQHTSLQGKCFVLTVIVAIETFMLIAWMINS